MIRDLTFAEKSALFAKLSNESYLRPREATRIFKKRNFDTHFISHKGSDCYILSNETDVVIVCRGTEAKQLNDIVADLNIDRTYALECPGLVHEGFRKYCDNIWDNIKNAALDAGAEYKDLWVCGHSLGAAMATIISNRFATHASLPKVKELFTYGSPRVGNKQYIHIINNNVIHHRWVNDGDVVTKVPFAPFFYHSGTMHFIDKAGNVKPDFDRKISVSRVLALLSVAGIFKLVMGDIKDHSSVNYVKHLDFWAEQSG